MMLARWLRISIVDAKGGRVTTGTLSLAEESADDCATGPPFCPSTLDDIGYFRRI